MSNAIRILLCLSAALAMTLACSSQSPTSIDTLPGNDQLTPHDGPDISDPDPDDNPGDDPGAHGTAGLTWHFVIDPAASGFYLGRDVLPTDDYGCLVLGGHHTGDERTQDIALYRFDSEGSVLWTQTYAGPGGMGDYPYSLIETGDGNFAFAALMSTGSFDICINKVDPNGTLLWRAPLGWFFMNTNAVLTEAHDGGFVAIGRFPSTQADGRIVKTDASGNVFWARSAVETGQQDFRGVVRSTDGGYVLAKVSNLGDANATDMKMLKTNADGDPLWERDFGKPGMDVAMSIVRTGETYVMGGWTPGSGGSDLCLIAVDGSGNKLWEVTDNSVLRTSCLDIAVAANGDLLVVGSENPNTCGLFGKIMVARFTPTGTMLWQKTYTQGEIGYYPAIAEAADGGILVVFDAGPQMHVMKLGPNGQQ